MIQNLGEILAQKHKILWKEGAVLPIRRTDLALEAHALWLAAAKSNTDLGIKTSEHDCCGYHITTVNVPDESCAKALGKPKGSYVTLDLRNYWTHSSSAFEHAVCALAQELRSLITRCQGGKCVLVVGLGNDAMTPDAIGPKSAEHILVTRHLKRESAFSSFASVSVLVPGVLGRTGMEAAEIVHGAVNTIRPDLIVAIDALASQRLSRLCTTVQLSDTGIIPGSGVGNDRCALDHKTLGAPVIAVGVPTVVDAATLCADVLEEAHITGFDPEALRGHERVMVTPRDIDAQIEEFSRIIGYGINLALQPTLTLKDIMDLLG